MYWELEKTDEHFIVSDDVVDVTFSTSCRCLPVDHAYALSQAIQSVLPWFATEKAGMHPFLVAESGNGWMRPDNPVDLLYPSRRSKLVLRVPQPRVLETQQLSGQVLNVAGYALNVEKSTVRPLSTITTIFSHYVYAGNHDEQTFLHEMVQELKVLGIRPKKMLPGKETIIATPERAIRGRSLMLAELTRQESLLLQQQGLGSFRHLGCGLFIPHKELSRRHETTEHVR